MLRKVRDHKSTFAVISLVLVLGTILASGALLFFHAPTDSMAAMNPARRHRTPTPVGHKTPTPIPQRTPTLAPPGSGTLQVFVEPEAGEKVILDAITGAQKSVWLEIYLLTDTNVIQALKDAAARKLDVQVLLENHPYGGSGQQDTIDALNAAGVKAKESSPDFRLTHEKGLIIDNQTVFIMTSNFTKSALTGKNREYGIIDTRSQDVSEVSAVFTADWNRTAIQPSNPSLVWSPTNAREKLTAFITAAKKTLIVEAEEMQDTDLENTLAAAAKNGVQVEVILPSARGTTDSNDAGISVLKAAGVQVKKDPQLIMHAKMMVADGNAGFVGSENISGASLDGNRELGILFNDQKILNTLQQTFQSDWDISVAA